MRELHVIPGPNYARKIEFFAFHTFLVKTHELSKNRVRAKLPCSACVCKSTFEITNAGSFCCRNKQLKSRNRSNVSEKKNKTVDYVGTFCTTKQSIHVKCRRGSRMLEKKLKYISQYSNMHGSEAFGTNFYIWCCSLCIQISF